ncbi:hypothetical protein Syun_011453 [Stephania yunnanensis]|uniref:Uncharacterized protein n=1 Tax=Stephania yunnanensis TaxID=152371 RepID=A0AAP0JYT4_9MAGN
MRGRRIRRPADNSGGQVRRRSANDNNDGVDAVELIGGELAKAGRITRGCTDDAAGADDGQLTRRRRLGRSVAANQSLW